MKRKLDVRKLDVDALARSGETLRGSSCLVSEPEGRSAAFSGASRVGRDAAPEMPRLAEMHIGPRGQVEWAARAYREEGQRVPGLRAPGESSLWLHLTVAGHLGLECQRCLQPVSVPIQVDRRFLFAGDERRAAELDAQLEEDVLALTSTLDLLALVEDEVLLDLPLVPLHERCEAPGGGGADAGPEAHAAPADHPFAPLAAWQGHGKKKD